MYSKTEMFLEILSIVAILLMARSERILQADCKNGVARPLQVNIIRRIIQVAGMSGYLYTGMIAISLLSF